MSTTAVRARQRARASSKIGKRRSKQIGDVITWVLLLLGGITMGGPFFWMVSNSVKPLAELYNWPPTIIPQTIQLTNYIEIWRKLPFERFFLNSFVVSTSSTLGVLFTSSLAGYSFARIEFPGRDKIFLAYLGTMMIPFAVVMIPIYMEMRAFGWVNQLTALIVPGLFSAWGTFMMRQFMVTIPRDLEDAAVVDGTGRFGIYWRIFLPLSKPVIATLGMFQFMGSWNALLWPLIIISSLNKKTLPLGLAAFQSMASANTPWHLIMAAAVTSVTPIMILFVLGQKYYVQGIVTTGLKGVS